MREPIPLADYHRARPIVEPFNMLDCSLNTDGAGAVVVTRAERARDLRRHPVLITGFGQKNNLRGWFHDDHMVTLGGVESARAAFQMAGIGPEDVDLAQIYDCFTYIVLATLEDYGFCKKGEGGPFAASGALELDGTLPTNTSGGQLSEGHVEGMLQITDSGQRHLALEQARNSKPAKRRRRWDKRYRLVMFDIPQERRNTRDRLRFLMREFGFLRLQDSVWVSPYDCEELVALIKAELRVGNDVLYAVVEQIGNEKRIKSHFGLS